MRFTVLLYISKVIIVISCEFNPLVYLFLVQIPAKMVCINRLQQENLAQDILHEWNSIVTRKYEVNQKTSGRHTEVSLFKTDEFIDVKVTSTH